MKTGSNGLLFGQRWESPEVKWYVKENVRDLGDVFFKTPKDCGRRDQSRSPGGLALALMKAVAGAPRRGGWARIGCTTYMPSPPPPLPRCLGTGANSVQTAHLGISARGKGMRGSDLSSSLPTWNPEARYGVKTELGHSPLESESGGLSFQGLVQGPHWLHTGS